MLTIWISLHGLRLLRHWNIVVDIDWYWLCHHLYNLWLCCLDEYWLFSISLVLIQNDCNYHTCDTQKNEKNNRPEVWGTWSWTWVLQSYNPRAMICPEYLVYSSQTLSNPDHSMNLMNTSLHKLSNTRPGIWICTDGFHLDTKRDLFNEMKTFLLISFLFM